VLASIQGQGLQMVSSKIGSSRPRPGLENNITVWWGHVLTWSLSVPSCCCCCRHPTRKLLPLTLRDSHPEQVKEETRGDELTQVHLGKDVGWVTTVMTMAHGSLGTAANQ